MKIIPNTPKLTLEHIKASNYWDLIALIVWNHYSEKKHQNENAIEITEQYYGVGINMKATSHSLDWNKPEHTRERFERKLEYIEIKFTRNDYTTRIAIYIADGRINWYASYNDESIQRSPVFQNYNTMNIANWMLANEFFISNDYS